MRIARKLALIALTVILIITGAVPAFADTQVKDQGVFGKNGNLTWMLYNDGTLVISGEGEMSRSEDDTVWDRYRESIKKVEIKNGITSIMPEAFKDCKNMSEAAVPEGVEVIYRSAFSGCSSLSEIALPKTLTVIKSSVFSGCSSLEKIQMQEGVVYLGYSAFSGCSSLKEIKLPQSLRSIGGRLFENCSSISEIRIPDNVNSVDVEAFNGCTSLKKVMIPDNSGMLNKVFNIVYYPRVNIKATVYKPEHSETQGSFDMDKISVTNQADGIRISWESLPDADSYTVWRQTLYNGKYSESEDVGREISYKESAYIDRTAYCGTTYRYYVVAHKYGITGKKSEKVVCCRLYQPAMGAVKTDSGSKITWTRVNGASGYQIYRKSSEGSKYKRIASVKGSSALAYTDRAGGSYEYRVRAYYKDNSGRYYYGPYSEAIAQVKNLELKADSAERKITLNWDKVKGATEYRIYRASQKNGKYRQVKSTRSVKFTDTDLKEGKTYYYKVQACCVTAAGRMSAVKSASIKKIELKTPEYVSVEYDREAHEYGLKWDAVEGADSYEIYRFAPTYSEEMELSRHWEEIVKEEYTPDIKLDRNMLIAVTSETEITDPALPVTGGNPDQIFDGYIDGLQGEWIYVIVACRDGRKSFPYLLQVTGDGSGFTD